MLCIFASEPNEVYIQELHLVLKEWDYKIFYYIQSYEI